MDPGTLLTTLYAVFVVIVGSAVQASVGMGLNLFAIPLLALADPVYVPGPVLANSFVLSILALRRFPFVVDKGELLRGIAGLIAGTGLAALILTVVAAGDLTRLLGLLIIGAVGLVLAGIAPPLTPVNVTLTGGAAGLMGTIAGLHAPPVALLYAREAPLKLRGALLTFILAGNVISLVALAAVGRFGRDEIIATLTLLPGVWIGLLAAPYLAKSLDAKSTRNAVLAISAASALILVIRG